MTDFDLVVLGLGGIGSGAAYWASRRLGDRVAGFEQYEVGHERGGSEDHSRIIRLSYHTPGYVDLAKSAYDAWETLESESGEQVILQTGGLDLAPEDATIGLEEYRLSMKAASVGFEELDAAEVMRRWPQWRLPESVTALYQERSGIAMASLANAVHRRLAAANGATLIQNAAVHSITETGGEVVIETDERRITAGAVVMAAGAWTNRLTSQLGVTFPLEVTQEQVVYLDPLDPALFSPGAFPVWIWMTEPSFYGFPIFGEPAVKVAWDRCEIVTTPDTRSFDPRPDVIEAIEFFVSAHLPDAAGAVRLSKTCLYTLTPDRDFIVDRLPGADNVFVVVGAGHAFKFASLLGRMVVDLALDGETEFDVAPFAATRAVLTKENPHRSYMV